MSVPLGKRLLTDFCQKSFLKFRPRKIICKSKSTSAAKQSSPEVIPAPEPGKIHAAVLCDFSNPLAIRNIDVPKCTQPNEVAIDVQYCAINASDVLLSKNSHYWEPKIPMVLGYELMGKVAEVGEEAQKSGYQVGDRVVALNKDLYGGLAERCTAEIGDVWKIPAAVKGVDAVCLFDNYMTALLALERQVSINEDDMIVVNVGVSGIGLAAVDLATNVYRAKVIGISATEDGASLVRNKGAFASLKFQDRKLMKHIEELAADRNIKAIFDGVGGEYFKKILNCFTDIYKEGTTMKDMLCNDNFAVVVHHLSREGRVIVAGTAISNMKSHTEVHQGTFSVTGFNLRAYRKKDPEAYRQAGDEVLQFFEEGLITPSCSLTAGLYKVNDALKYAYDMKSSGKVVIDIRNKDADATENKQNQ